MKKFSVKNSASHSDDALPGWRAMLLFALLLASLAVLLGRGMYLQVVQDDFLQEKGNARYTRVINVSAHRGMITDRHGTPLAVSTPVQSVWVNPESVKATPQQVSELAKLLEMDVAEVQARLHDEKRDFVYLKRQITPDLAEKVKALGLSGLALQPEYRRYYPAAEEAAQLLGFTDQNDAGVAGVEQLMQKELAGKLGSQRVIKDRRGHIVEDVGGLRPPKPGIDIALSIDLNVQHLAYRELKNAIEQHRAKSGSVVVLDAQSGEVLALANYPGFNPNNRISDIDLTGINLKDANDRKRAEERLMPTRNRAVVDAFEPGSTMKPFAVAIALEQGLVKPNTIFDTEHGVITVGGRRIHDSHPQDRLTVAEIIQKSSNVGTTKIALQLEPQKMWQGLSDSGFGAPTGSKLPGESFGRLRPAKTWKPIEQATMSYGHGLSVNLLQLARAYTVYANKGELMPVTLFKQSEPVIGKRVFSERTAVDMLKMLETVTQPGGTAPLAQVPGYRVAGKTGTAHKLENGHYVNKYVASFVGVAPVSNPRVIVAVMVDEPSNGQYYGGLVAAPVFGKVVGAVLQSLNVPYDAPLNNVIAPPADIVKEEV